MNPQETFLIPVAQEGDFKARNHARVVAASLPRWLLDAPPDVQAALRASQVRSQVARQALTEWLAPLPGLETFAQTRLEAALQPLIGQVDVRKQILARKKDITSLGVPRLQMTRQTLLHAALQNFVENEAFLEGSLVLPDHALVLEDAGMSYRVNPGSALAITAAQFARLCRTQDIGGAYQLQLKQYFSPSAQAERIEALFTDNDRHGLEVLAHIGHLRKHLSEPAYRMLLDLAAGRPATWHQRPVRASALRMMHSSTFDGGDLHGPLLLDTTDHGPCVLYLPQEPEQPLQEFASLQAAHDALRNKLRAPAYLRYWQRFVSHAHLAPFLDHLKDRLTPLVTTFPATPRRAPDPEANLFLERVALTGPLFAAVHARRVARVLDDGRTLAMPTAEVDQQQRDERNRSWLSAGLELLGVVALFIPGVGELMLACAAAQLVYEVYTGVQDWRHGDADAAATHALGVAENLALLAVMSAGTALAARPRVPMWPQGAAFDELQPLRLPSGAERLLRPTLDGYAQRLALPGDLPLNDDLVMEYLDQEYVLIQGRPYAVRFDGDRQAWRVIHPEDHNAYQPLVTEDSGVWQLEPEQAEAVTGRSLRTLLDGPAAHLDSQGLGLAMRCAGVEPELLDQVFYRGTRASALLTDTLERFDIDLAISQHRQGLEVTRSSLAYKLAETFQAEAQGSDDNALFKALYDDSHFGSDLANGVVRRDFPSLPVAVAEELLRKLSPKARLALAQAQRLPLAVAEQARLYQQALRLNRALEGLCRARLATPDSAVLAGNFRKRLGAQASAAQIRDAALADREQCAHWLKQQPPAAFFSAPARDELGRWGYGMSGRRAGELPADNPSQNHMVSRVRALFPALGRPQALEYLRYIHRFGRRYDDALAILDAHQAEYQQLDIYLQLWVEAQPSAEALRRFNGDLLELQHQRRDVRSRLLMTWRRNGPDEFPHELNNPALDLSGLSLLELPPLMHAFNFIARLDLSHSHLSAEGLGELLLNFRQLRDLELSNAGLQVLPDLSHQRATLRNLELGGNHLLLDQAMMDELGRLPALRTLSLNGNLLLGVTQANGFARLRNLDLGNTALGNWPEWVATLPRLRALNLTNTGLVQLPEQLWTQQGEGRLIQVDLRSNPFPAPLRRRIVGRALAGRLFDLYFTEPPVPWSAEHLSSPWLLGLNSVDHEGYLNDWRALIGHGRSVRFLNVLEDLRSTPQYTLDRVDLSRRVLELVQRAVRIPTLRTRLFDIARFAAGSEDATVLTFSDLEMAAFGFEPADPELNPQSGQLLYSRLRSMFRDQQIHDYATRLVFGDLRIPGLLAQEPTVRLQLRATLGEHFAMPAHPLRGPVPGTALLDGVQVEAARQALVAAEQGEDFIQYLISRQQWVAHLMRNHSMEINAVLAPFEAVGDWPGRDQAREAIFAHLTRAERGDNPSAG